MGNRTFTGNQPAYAICRMGIAMDRLAASNSPEEKNKQPDGLLHGVLLVEVVSLAG